MFRSIKSRIRFIIWRRKFRKRIREPRLVYNPKTGLLEPKHPEPKRIYYASPVIFIKDSDK